jgi:hypothetical protein
MRHGDMLDYSEIVQDKKEYLEEKLAEYHYQEQRRRKDDMLTVLWTVAGGILLALIGLAVLVAMFCM